MKNSDIDLFQKLSDLLKRGAKLAVATVVATRGSTPREPGARMIVLPDGGTEGTVGGGALEKKVGEDALEMLAGDGPSRLVRYSLTDEASGGIGAACGGESDVFIEIFRERQKMLILGGGHVGIALARIAALSGFAVTVVEDRAELADPERFPSARVLCVPPGDPSVTSEAGPSTAVVIVTRSHALDLEALRLFIGSPAFYVGMIGSKKKVASILEALEKEGAAKARIGKVYAPIGLDIGAESPEEIAVSIVAEIIAVKRAMKPSPISLKLSRGGSA
jgi:xanthine dehydrogenase accessory factor